MKIANLQVLPGLTLLQKLDNSGEKLKNSHFLVIFRGLNGIRYEECFSKIRLEPFLLPIHVLPKCQISENSDVRILNYPVTDEQTNGRDSLGLFSANCQETKKLYS